MDQSAPMTSIRQKVASGTVWVILTRFIDRGIGFLSTLILARILLPSDFGVLALTMSVVAILDLIRRFGFELVLVSQHDAGRDHFDTVWTLNILFSVAVSLLIVLAAQPTADFYDEPKLVSVMMVVALRPLFEGLRNVGVVSFQKELRFAAEFRYLTIVRIAAFAIGITLGLILRNYWALVIAMVASHAVRTGLSYVVHPYRPRLSLKSIRELMSFSSWLAISNVAQLVIIQGPTVIIGKLVGTHALGVFSLSYELGFLPSTELSAPINRAVFPAYASKGSDEGALGRGFLEVIAVIAMVVVPTGVGLAAVAEFAVPVLLGEKWRDAIPLVALLALYGSCKALYSNTGYIFLVTKRPWMILFIGLVEAAILVPLLLYGVATAGVIGACWALLVSIGVTVPMAFGFVLSQLRVSVWALLDRIWRPAISGGVMWMAVAGVKTVMTSSGQGVGLLDELVICSGVGAVIYVASELALWKISGCPDGAEQVALNGLAEGRRRGLEYWNGFRGQDRPGDGTKQ